MANFTLHGYSRNGFWKGIIFYINLLITDVHFHIIDFLDNQMFKVTFLDGELKSNRRQPCSCLNWCSIDKTWHKGPSGVKSKKWRTCKKIFFIRNYLEETFLRRIRKRNDHVITCWNKNELTGSLGNGGFLAPLPRQSSWNWIICEINWAKDFAVGGSLWTCWKY